MKKVRLFFAVIFFLSPSVHAQDSCQLSLSLLTCSPGTELYSTFGHTAIRVKDNSSGSDIVFNYGTFEFGPDFYIQFIKGKLRYFLSVEAFPDFIYIYKYDNRAVLEQKLLFDCNTKQKLYAALQLNAQEANRYYRYDFLRDNCTTRARNMILAAAPADTTYTILPHTSLTFRNQIHQYLNRQQQWWSKLGIDLLLGLPLDKKVSNTEAQFLPDYLLRAMDTTFNYKLPIVSTEQTLLAAQTPPKGSVTIGPLPLFVLLFAGVALASSKQTKTAKKFLSFFDPFFFFFLGLVGLLLVFMWAGTDHAVCAYNFNILWALPTHMMASFFYRSPHRIARWYFLGTFWLSAALLVNWWWLPQNLNEALLPIVLCICIRSWHLSKRIPYVATTK